LKEIFFFLCLIFLKEIPPPKQLFTEPTQQNAKNRFQLSSNLNSNNFSQSSMKNCFKTPETNYLLNSQSSKNPNNYKRNQVLQQGSSELFEMNQRHFSNADETFKVLQIENSIEHWMNNCERWLFKNILSQFLQDNSENIYELNSHLTTYFGKYLYEIQIFDNSSMNLSRNNRYTRVAINDLMIYYETLKKNSNFWSPMIANIKEINKINEKMKNLLYIRDKLEKYIKIPEYENFQIRFLLYFSLNY